MVYVALAVSVVLLAFAFQFGRFNLAAAPVAPGSVILVVRAHRPSQHSLMRTRQLAETADVYVSLDCTALSTAEIRGIRAALKDIPLHTYTSGDMSKEYPALLSLSHLRYAGSFGYGFHAEALGLLLAHLPAHASTIWVLEDDAAFAGPAAALLSAHAQSRADLLLLPTPGENPASLNDVSHWFNREIGTELFLRDVKRTWSLEMVQRFSLRFLRYLHECSKKGVIAWSEMSVPSLCVHGGFSWERINSRNVGRQCSAFGHRISLQEWESTPANNRLYHPLKF